MRRIVCWRWVLPFVQLCLILVCVQWLADQRGAHTFVPPPALVEEGHAVGWDPRSCWDCDSVAPILRLLFLGVLGVFFFVGVQLDRQLAVDGGRLLIFVLAAASCMGAVTY